MCHRTRHSRVRGHVSACGLRSAELRCGAEHLCKTLLLENKSCSGDGGRTALDSRFVCVVVQYVSKFSSDDLATGLASMGQASGLDVTKGSFAFQMADQETAHRLSGFEFNALTPFGMKTEVPVRVRAWPWWHASTRASVSGVCVLVRRTAMAGGRHAHDRYREHRD